MINFRDESGQSMVGMLAVIVIIGILGWYLMGGSGDGGSSPQDTINKTKEVQGKQELATLRRSIKLYRSKNGQYPPDLQILVDEEMVAKSALTGPDGNRYEYNPETGKVSQ